LRQDTLRDDAPKLKFAAGKMSLIKIFLQIDMNAMGRAVLELLKPRLSGGSGMYFSPKTILTAMILLVASVSLAQEGTPSAEDAILARLSYDNSGFPQPGSVSHVCFAVSKNGDYRIVRLLEPVRVHPGDDGVQRLRGNLPKEEFHQLSNLLEAADFRSLSGNRWPSVIRQEAETFAAEIAVNGQWHHSSAVLNPPDNGIPKDCCADCNKHHAAS